MIEHDIQRESLWSPRLDATLSHLDAIACLPTLTEKRQALLKELSRHSPLTYDHVMTVKTVATDLMEVAGIVSPVFVVGAEQHDIGKLLVPDHILSRPSNAYVTASEMRHLWYHPAFSRDIALFVGFDLTTADLLRFHHADFESIKQRKDLYHGDICLPSLLRLADSIAAALDMHRRYQGQQTLRQILIDIRDKLLSGRIQTSLFPIYQTYMRERSIPNLDAIPL